MAATPETYQETRAHDLGFKDEKGQPVLGVGKRYTEDSLYRFMYLAEEALKPARIVVTLGLKEIDTPHGEDKLQFTTITKIEGISIEEAASRLMVLRESGPSWAFKPIRRTGDQIDYASTTIGPNDTLALFNFDTEEFTHLVPAATTLK